MIHMRESDEVAAHQWRLAQANRLQRFCMAQGVDLKMVMSGEVDLDLSPICDKQGKIRPEQEDIDNVN
jgi:hypothetical protein